MSCSASSGAASATIPSSEGFVVPKPSDDFAKQLEPVPESKLKTADQKNFEGAKREIRSSILAQQGQAVATNINTAKDISNAIGIPQ